MNTCHNNDHFCIKGEILVLDDFKMDAMKALNSYINWLEQIIDSINDGILVIDELGIVRLINKEYTKITGVERNRIIDKKLLDVRKGAILPSVLVSGRKEAGIYREEGESKYIVDMAPIYNDDQIIGAVSVLKSVSEVDKLAKELRKSREALSQLENMVGTIYQARYTFDDILGKDNGLKETVKVAKKAAFTDLNILIQGESGTGKELFAHAIHHVGTRSNFSFVPVNCAAIPAALLEAELFGYEDGTFTNSKKGGKKGLFVLANKGTLFLDEIGDMPLELQAKILRVLQDGRIRKVGGLHEEEIDIRVIAATNKDLSAMIHKQRFREDLFYRINGIQFEIPPLRNRKMDLRDQLHDMFDKSRDCVLTPEARDTLLRYDWPGNTREFFNVIQYAMNMVDHGVIEVAHLPELVTRNARIFPNGTLKEVMKNTEREIIQQALNYFGETMEGKKKAAASLGISLATLYNKLISK
jgi:PAS domain S-box-containing protein